MLFKIQINNHLFSARKYYLKLLLSFLFMATLIVLSISIIFTQLYTKDIYDQLSVDYVNNISSVQHEFDNVFSQLKNTYVFMIQLPDINNFLTSPNNDLSSINRASGYLTSLNSINPYLYSTIVFNKDTDFVLTAGKFDYADIKQFTDNKIKRLDIKSDLNIVSCTLNQSAARSTKPFDTISVIFMPSDSENVFNNAVIMNVDRNEIEKRLLANIEGGIIVADNSGTVVFESYSGLSKNSIADETYFHNILSSDFLKGSFKFTQNGSPAIVSYTKSIMTDLYIINIRSINKYSDIIFKK
ncbi:MAG TPA: hypothetical protein GXX36_12060 [Clostridiaceae bacterium]|nr:hypothetical protein [Clostridiaceae bacterium]